MEQELIEALNRFTRATNKLTDEVKKLRVETTAGFKSLKDATMADREEIGRLIDGVANLVTVAIAKEEIADKLLYEVGQLLANYNEGNEEDFYA